VVVAVVGLILDGLRAAYYPAVTALLCGLSVLLQIRYPQSMKHWTRRRIIDTAAFIVLAAGLLLLGGWFIMTKPDGPSVWTVPVTTLVIIVATMPFAIARLVRVAFRDLQAAQRSANERDHGSGHTT
jgi:4-hydroxybenzoate polyprenyltransferase